MNEEEQIILDIRVNYDDAIAKIAEYCSKIDDLTEAKKELEAENAKLDKSNEAEAAQWMENQKQIEAINAEMQQEKNTVRELAKEVQNGLKQDKEKEGSLRGLRAELSNVTKEYDALSRTEREGAKGKEYADKINRITTELKEAEAATQRYYRNVGNYENAITNALGANSKWFSSLQAIAGGMQGGFKNAVTVAGQAVAGFGKQLLVLLANPIVAIIAAIAGAFKLLSDAIKNNEENMDRWKVVTAPLGRIFELISNKLQQLAGVILSVVEAGGKMMSWVMNMLEKVPILGEQFRQLNDEMRDSIELEREAQSIRNEHRKEEVEQAKASLESQRLLTKAYDKANYSAKERLGFLRQATKIEQDRADAAEKLAKRELVLAQRRASISKNDSKTNDELAAKEAAYYQAQQQREALQTSLKQREGRLLAQIKSEENAAAKASTDRAKAVGDAAAKILQVRQKELQLIRQEEDALLALVEEGIMKQRKTIELQYTRQIEDLRRTLTTEKDLTAKGREAINQTITALEKKKVQELKKLSDEEVRTRIETEQRIIQNVLETVKQNSEQELALKRQQLYNEEQLEVEAAQKEVTDAEERERLILSIHAKYDAQREKMDADAYNAYLDQLTKETETRFKTAIAQAGNNELEVLRLNVDMRKELLDQAQQQEGESIEAFNLRKLEMENEYQQAKKDLADKEVAIEQSKLQAAAGVANGMSQVFEAMGEDNTAFAQLSKVLALAEIAINTGKAIAAGVAQAQSVPYPGNLVAIATTVATVLANIATAIKTVKSAKFAQGGTIIGAGSGTSDSISARVSNGESVVTQQATSMFSPLLSALNQLGGGVPIVATSPQQQIGEDMLANAFARGAAMMPRPVVSVEEINTTNNRIEVLERLSKM